MTAKFRQFKMWKVGLTAFALLLVAGLAIGIGSTTIKTADADAPTVTNVEISSSNNSPNNTTSREFIFVKVTFSEEVGLSRNSRVKLNLDSGNGWSVRFWRYDYTDTGRVVDSGRFWRPYNRNDPGEVGDTSKGRWIEWTKTKTVQDRSVVWFRMMVYDHHIDKDGTIIAPAKRFTVTTNDGNRYRVTTLEATMSGKINRRLSLN